jgi:hypothetical protein
VRTPLLLLGLCASALLLAAHPAIAAPTTYTVELAGKGLLLEVPYSLGTHKERATAVEGSLLLDPDTFALSGGELLFPLDWFHSDSLKRLCHLREAIGLDYARSRFPKEHVCDEDQVPASGDDAIAFPNVRLKLTGGHLQSGTALPARDEVSAVATGTLTLHGVTRPVQLALTVSRDPDEPGALRIRGRHPLLLADFGVVVKSAHVLFVQISVGETVTVVVDARLVPRSR